MPQVQPVGDADVKRPATINITTIPKNIDEQNCTFDMDPDPYILFTQSKNVLPITVCFPKSKSRNSTRMPKYSSSPITVIGRIIGTISREDSEGQTIVDRLSVECISLTYHPKPAASSNIKETPGQYLYVLCLRNASVTVFFRS